MADQNVLGCLIGQLHRVFFLDACHLYLEWQVGVLARTGQSAVLPIYNVRLQLAVSVKNLLPRETDAANTVEPETPGYHQGAVCLLYKLVEQVVTASYPPQG